MAARGGGLGAGLLIVRESDGKGLLVRRSPDQSWPGHWSPPGGKIEGNEEPIEAALREAGEEFGPLPPLDILRDEGYWHATGPFFAFGTFLGLLRREDERWEPTLNPENEAWGWFGPRELPRPLLPGAAAALKDLSGRSWRWKPPHMGILAPENVFSACKAVNLDTASRFHLTFGVTVVDDASSRAASLTVPFLDRVPGVLWVPSCRRMDFESAMDRYQPVSESDPSMSLFCARGLDWDGVLDFVLEDVRAEAPKIAVSIEPAMTAILETCLGR